MNLLRALALVGAAAVMMCTAPMAGTSTSTAPQPARSTPNHAYLGVQAGDATSGGAVVLNVAPGGPADSARIEVGDVITAVNGHSVAGASALQTAIARMAPRARASLTVIRNGTPMTVDAVLGTEPEF